ncbi:ABC transporter permease [Halodurantibacterium flavum]|uniref:ABC transporter permease n=1 Tax=Halodurantibacterium flavum TaxID=1382802 RepID=A0ABW4SAA4_9RHOB
MRVGPSEGLVVVVARLAFLLVLVALWSLAAQTGPRGIIPSPTATWEAGLRMWDDQRLQRALGDSLLVFSAGFGAAAVIGIATGFLMGSIRMLGRTLDIFVYALAATPRVAFIPLVILLLGLGVEAKAFIVFLGAVMPVILNTYAGVRQSDPDLLEMARAAGASRFRTYAHVVLPGVVPFLVVGLRLGATIGLINTVVAELYTAVRGLGGLLALYGNTFRMAEYFVVVLMLALIGVTVTEGLRLVEQRLSRWRETV